MASFKTYWVIQSTVSPIKNFYWASSGWTEIKTRAKRFKTEEAAYKVASELSNSIVKQIKFRIK